MAQVKRTPRPDWDAVVEDLRFLKASGESTEMSLARLQEAGTYTSSRESLFAGLRRHDRDGTVDLREWLAEPRDEPSTITKREAKKATGYRVKGDGSYVNRPVMSGHRIYQGKDAA